MARLTPILLSFVAFGVAVWLGLFGDVSKGALGVWSALLPVIGAAALVAATEIMAVRRTKRARSRTLFAVGAAGAAVGLGLATGLPLAILYAPAFSGFWFGLSVSTLYLAFRPGQPPLPADPLGLDVPLTPAQRRTAWPIAALCLGALLFLLGFGAIMRGWWAVATVLVVAVPLLWSLAVFKQRGSVTSASFVMTGAIGTVLSGIVATLSGLLGVAGPLGGSDPASLLWLPAQIALSAVVAVPLGYALGRLVANTEA